MTTIGQFDVSWILIDVGSSWHILYLPVFEKMGLDRGSVIPYDDLDLQPFNWMTTSPWGYVELMVSLREERYLQSINTLIVVITCRSLYNYILGRPFTTMLNVVASPMHLNLKCYNFHREPVVLRANLEWTKNIHHALHISTKREQVN